MRVRKILDSDFVYKRKGAPRTNTTNPDALRTREKRRIVREYYESVKQPCLFCGGDDHIEFHHFNPTRKSRNMHQIKSIETAQDELQHVWQLCALCHLKLHLGSVVPLPCCYD